MPEYIDRNKILNDPMLHTYKKKDLLEKIKCAPAADVAPVLHGRWEDIEGIITCSACGNGHMLAMYPHYCPNCGAKMDEDKP